MWAAFRVAQCSERQSWAPREASSLTPYGQIPSSPGVRGPLLGRPGHSPDPKMSARPLLACPLPRLSLQCCGPAPASAARAHPPTVQTTNPDRPLGLVSYNFKRPKFGRTTTTDSLRDSKEGLGVPWGRSRSGFIRPHPKYPIQNTLYAHFLFLNEHSGNCSLCNPSCSSFRVCESLIGLLPFVEARLLSLGLL